MFYISDIENARPAYSLNTLPVSIKSKTVLRITPMYLLVLLISNFDSPDLNLNFNKNEYFCF